MIHLSFDDVLLLPKYSTIKSREDVNTKVNLLGSTVHPIISANMDTITGTEMATEMLNKDHLACLHRFQTPEQQAKQFTDVVLETKKKPWVAVGLGENELARTKRLAVAGATHFLIDVAHGATSQMVDQIVAIKKALLSPHYLIVGNFATGDSVSRFLEELKKHNVYVDALKIGIGGGSMCTTRIVTGVGLPTLASILDIRKVTSLPLIADGGIKSSADYAKALAAGANAVMLGKLLSGTNEAAGTKMDGGLIVCKYRGSASHESYEVQNKVSSHRTPEGESGFVPYKGTVKSVLQQLDAGLRSSMSYLGASNLQEFQNNADLGQITEAGRAEGEAHGKKT